MNVGIHCRDLAMKRQQRALGKPFCLRCSGEPETGQKHSVECAFPAAGAVSTGI